MEIAEVRGALEFSEATGVCSEGLPLSVKELMAHLHHNCHIQCQNEIFWLTNVGCGKHSSQKINAIILQVKIMYYGIE